MRVYVDAAVHRWRGKLWCHMFTPDLTLLHDFALQIGMKREWFQDPRTTNASWPHFDVPAWRRDVAIRLGAIALDRHQTVAMSRVVINCFEGNHGTERAVDPLATHRRLNSARLPELEHWLDAELHHLGLATPGRLAA